MGVLLFIFGIDADGYGAIVYQSNFHISAKNTRGYFFAGKQVQGIFHLLIKRDGLIWPGGTDKGGTVAFFGLGKQGELRDKQDVAINVGQAFVHQAGLVAKNAHAGYFLCQPLQVFGGIGIFNTQQHQKAGANLPGNFTVHCARC